MATHDQIAAAIKAVIETVPDRGPVHDFLRYAKNTGALATLFKNTVTNRFNGHEFYRESTRELELDVGSLRRLDAWRIYSYMAFDDADAAAKTFQTQLEAIKAAFRADRTLGGLVIDLKDMNEARGRLGLQIEMVEPWVKAGVLCLRSSAVLITESEELA